jgi:hypothetical protein
MGFSREVGHAPGQEFCQNKVNCVRLGRAAGHEDVNFNELVYRAGVEEQFRNDLSRDVLIVLRVLDVCAAFNLFELKPVSHAWDIGGHCAVAQRNEDFRPLANFSSKGEYLGSLAPLRANAGVPVRAPVDYRNDISECLV